MSTTLKLSLHLPCIPNVETVAHAALDRLGGAAHIDSDRLEHAKLLVSEAIVNAIEHSGRRRHLKVELKVDSNALSIFIKDYGKGLDTDTLKRMADGSSPTELQKRGWGLQLMQQLSDEFNIETGKNGTTIHLLLNLH